MDAVIQTSKLTKYFGSKKVVDSLDLTVPRGAIYALLGDNGAGKSTTIRTLTGLLAPDVGSATVLGENAWTNAYALRHRVGYVPEKPRFYDWMTVTEIGTFTAGFHGAGYRERYLEHIDGFGLERTCLLSKLSKGGYARVALALALAIDPEVLILDEPTSGLDLFTRREFLSSMVELAAEGRTILISSHAVAELERVVSHVAFLGQGQLLLAGTLDELRQRFLRIRLRADGTSIGPEGLGNVLEVDRSGKEWQAVLLDPDRVALEDLRHRSGVLEMEETSLTLEEMYAALLARFHPPRTARAAPARTEPEAALADRGGRP